MGHIRVARFHGMPLDKFPKARVEMGIQSAVEQPHMGREKLPGIAQLQEIAPDGSSVRVGSHRPMMSISWANTTAVKLIAASAHNVEVKGKAPDLSGGLRAPSDRPAISPCAFRSLRIC
jgi:hypothetical protein